MSFPAYSLPSGRSVDRMTLEAMYSVPRWRESWKSPKSRFWADGDTSAILMAAFRLDSRTHAWALCRVRRRRVDVRLLSTRFVSSPADTLRPTMFWRCVAAGPNCWRSRPFSLTKMTKAAVGFHMLFWHNNKPSLSLPSITHETSNTTSNLNSVAALCSI